jgi:hypothetical protein
VKALELKVFNIWETFDGYWYADSDDPQYPLNVGYEVQRKRLKDVELAAELYRAGMWLAALGRAAITSDRMIRFAPAYVFGPITREEYEFETVNRFLHLPHYDEENK